MDINSKLIVNAVHEYDNLARLSWMISILDPYQNPSPSTMIDRRNEITYDANGRISQVTSTTHWLKTPSDYYYSITYSLSYDGQGRISSIRQQSIGSPPV
ncbi:hypothetical protein EFB08_06530 [Rufibacter latericius]|uniref:Uncharacterized protein n=1 Tax=Rufibacter latericius TaxID=2487040 RepID=A0A3M9MU80_9BACT|nr:hypothetical protein EFB08_06530 [Rufibacter latericius]